MQIPPKKWENVGKTTVESKTSKCEQVIVYVIVSLSFSFLK